MQRLFFLLVFLMTGLLLILTGQNEQLFSASYDLDEIYSSKSLGQKSEDFLRSDTNVFSVQLSREAAVRATHASLPQPPTHSPRITRFSGDASHNIDSTDLLESNAMVEFTTDETMQCRVGHTDENIGADTEVEEEPTGFRSLPQKFLQMSPKQKSPKCGEVIHPWLHQELYEEGVSMLFLVKSAPENWRARQLIRQTWANIYYLHEMTFRTVFLLGVTFDDELQGNLTAENEKYGDLLQCRFYDDYNNLPVKVLSSFRWVVEENIKAQHFTVTDDDCLMNLPNIRAFFMVHSEDALYCGFTYASTARPIRAMGNKWFVSKEIYPGLYYPKFCHGGMYTLTTSVIRDINCIAEYTDRDYVHLEDVYITGILREKSSIPVYPVTRSGRKFTVMYYAWVEPKLKSLLWQWLKWNYTLPWKTTSNIDGKPMLRVNQKQQNSIDLVELVDGY